MSDDRAVSEVLGFVMVASLIISTVGIVYVAGIGGLTDARNAERVQNAERAFDVLADNLEDQRTRGAPSRATEIKLAEAQLSYGTPTKFQMNVSQYGGLNATATKTVNPIVFSTGRGTQVVYDSGAVMRVDERGAVLKNSPAFVFTESDGKRVAVVPLMQTRQTGPTSVGGTTTVLVRTETAVREVLISNRSGPYNVMLELETAPLRAQVWADYLNRSETIPDSFHKTGTTCQLDGGTVTCDLELERVMLTRTGIDVRFA